MSSISRLVSAVGRAMLPSALLTIPCLLAMSQVAVGATWPEIPDSEWEITGIHEYPNATALVLVDEGRMVFDELGVSSYLQVYRRLKILTDEGSHHGTISIPSSQFYRVKELAGRTHLPGGRVVELPDNAVFDKEYSSYFKRAMVSFALPEVVAGAIVEYRYKVFFDSVVYTQPWYFQDELPILASSITYVLPEGYRFAHDLRRTLRNLEVKLDERRAPAGYEVVFSAVDVPPVPDEPFRFPFEDLSTRVVLLPLEFKGTTIWYVLLEDWDATIDLFQGNRDYGYKNFRLRAGSADGKAKELTSGVSSKEDRARALYQFVRDEITTESYTGVGVGDRTADDVLKKGRGDYAEKAVLLQRLLEGAKIDSELAWANPVDRGRVNPNVPNPGQFDQVLVAIDLDGRRVFVDPCDRRLAFGALEPALRGVLVLLVDGKKPEWTQTPATSHSDSVRHAVLDLEVTGEGALKGTGALELTGYHAWERLQWKDTKQDTLDAWTRWIEERLPGLAISEVTVDEDLPGQRVKITWSLVQREEEVLGDEVTVAVAAPLARTSNPFTLAPEQRMTPVQMDYPHTEQVDLKLRWPEGRSVEGSPQFKDVSNSAGALRTSVGVNRAERLLTVSRVLEVHQREFIGPQAYGDLRGLYQAVAVADAESVVLVEEGSGL